MKKATFAQKQFITDLVDDSAYMSVDEAIYAFMDEHIELDDLTIDQASELIDELKC